MQSKKIGEIKAAIRDQAYNGRRSVRIDAGRVISVRTAKGQLLTREEQTFLSNLPLARYKLVGLTVVSVWFDDDPNGELVVGLRHILTEYGAVDATVNDPGQPHTWSFGFRTPEALNQARRVFPLPARLEAGSI